MTTRSECLARAIEGAVPLFARYLAGFDDENRTEQVPDMPNHAAWTLGHLALTANRGAEWIEGHAEPQALPAADFVTGDGRAGTADRFDSESVCFGSTPVDDAALYPSWDRCLAIVRGAHERLATAARAGSDADLDRLVRWGSGTITAEQVGHRMIFHLATHTGQLVDLRRGLGMDRLLG